MSKGLMFSSRRFRNKLSGNLVPHFSIINELCSSVDFITVNTTSGDADILNDITDITIDETILFYREYYHNNKDKVANWEEFYEKLPVDILSDYSQIFIMGGINLPNSGLSRDNKRQEVFPKDKGQLKFVSAGVNLCIILALLKAHRTYSIPMHEISLDPDEFLLSMVHEDYKPIDGLYYAYHGYDIPRYGIHRLDTAQYFFDKKVSHFDSEPEKCYDITFGYVILKNNDGLYRNGIKDEVSRIVNSYDSSNLYIRDEYEKINTLVPKEIYLDKIKQSKYTLILPAYNRSCFSIYRLIESLYADCLPYIHPSCALDELHASFNTDLSPLIYKGDKISDADRGDLLVHYKEIFCNFKRGLIV